MFLLKNISVNSSVNEERKDSKNDNENLSHRRDRDLQQL